MERSYGKLFWNEVSISTENQTVRRFYKKLRKENAEKDSDVYFGNENSFEEQNVETTEGNTEKQTKGHDENIAEFECKGINKKQGTGTILNLFKKQEGVTSTAEKKQTTKIYFEDIANFTGIICPKIAVEVGKEILPIIISSRNNTKDCQGLSVLSRL